MKELLSVLKRRFARRAGETAFFSSGPLELERAWARDIARRRFKFENIDALSSGERAKAKRRIVKAARRKALSRKDGWRLDFEDQLLLLRRFRTSTILSGVLPKRDVAGYWVGFRDRDVSERVNLDLKNFSFLDNPNGTLADLEKIAEAEARASEVVLNFDDE